MVVVGPVGAGKSSLLQCMLKELPVLNGDLTVRGTVAYASQESWLFSGTLRDNILFGMPYRSDWYNKVLNLCALEKDIAILLNGDQTLVGERGVILSGGQKARVNLARAIYRNADIYLLDDPLSAVDAAVSKLIFQRCIKGHLRKQGKLIVLVTHQIQYVNECDSILALKNGKMTSHDRFIEIIEDTESVTDEPQCTGVYSESEEKVLMPQKVTKHEDNEQGGVSLSTYYHYFKTGGGYFITVLVFLFFFSVEASVVTTDWWLTKHMSNNDSNWLAVYSGLTGAVILLSFMRTFFFFILLLRASYFLHNKMFAAVLRAPVFFFDNNPVGKVLNRFSKDIGYMDDQLQIFYTLTLMMASFFCGVMTLAVASNPFILIAVLVLGAVFIILRWLYVCGTRNIKRLEALARSPIFSQLSSTLQGLPVIRSYSMESAVMNKFHNYQNRNSQAWYLFICTVRWGVVCNDLTCTTFVMIFALVSIPLATSFNGALLSLALTYAVSISNQLFGYIMWTSGDVESYMISTERVLGYTRLEPEAPLESKSKPLPDWPNKGHIELRNVEYRHSSNGPLVLNNISLTITASEKVGIVGRTGAGKSSLIAALFRLAEPKGSIKIDGVECLDLGLHDVRSKISIIPQEPVLFSGTIRYNLDPFEQYDDHMIWKTLEYVQLKDLIGGLKGRLKAAVSEGGSNFSVGQKQLFCLARALLRNNRILVLDEATANVDMETDAIVQKVIRDHFSHCTVLAIAHRLDTVMDYDKIMVLDKGKVCEYGSPHELMRNPASVLLQLVESTGPVAAENLKNIAAAAHWDNIVITVTAL